MRLSFSRESVRRGVGMRGREKGDGVLRSEGLRGDISRLVFSSCMELGVETEQVAGRAV